MSVQEAQTKIDAREYAEWVAYSQFDPFGLERQDMAAAMICTVIANSNRSKNTRPFAIKDFMPEFKPIAITLQDREACLKKDMERMLAKFRGAGILKEI